MANESIKAAFQRLWEHTINQISDRVEKEEGKGLSTNDFTDEYKNKIDIQPDWNQNDETALDYVKNRTHWSEGITEVEIYPETTIQITTDDSSGLLSETEPIGLVADDNYAITYNGTDYTCTAIDASMFMNGMPATAIGNVGLAFGTGDSGEPFIIAEFSPEVAAEMGAYAMMIDLSGSTEVTVRIIHLQETVHKIPNKYLPKVTVPKNIIDGKSLGSLRTLGANAASEIGQFAFAEGQGTKASGDSSHAEGSNTTASGDYSHAEGFVTTASGDYSHTEGLNAKASGNSSHAEGQGTTATGNTSHAEGLYTIASSSGQHVQGKYNIEDTRNKYAHIVGNGTNSVKSNAHTLDWNGNAWFAGKVTVGSDNKELGTAGKDVKGTVYTINGSNVTAGTGAEIFNSYSSNIATGTYSHAEGSNTIASGASAHAEGSNTIASGVSAHAEGSNTIASGASAHAEGRDTLASNRSTHAEGEGTIASGQYSHAEGYYTTASGNYSHAEGFGSRISRSTLITGDANATTYTANEWSTSFIIGQILYYKDQSTETYAKITAIDKDNLSITLDKTLSSQGLNDANVYFIYGIAIGQYSHSEGYYTSASGVYSHAEGKNTIASSNGSHAEGSSTIAGSEYQHVQGKFNIENKSGTYAHIVGNGTATNNRSNAHTLDWNGNAWFQGDVYINSTSGKNKDEGSKKLATEEFVTQKVAEIDIETPTEYESIILKSSASGSTKKFRLTINDDGVLSAEEVIE